uniref:RNA-dependent RNA polymerase n=1 Tax=Erysiphales narna-like virus 1 TaxID=2719864 RepID=A0A6G9ELT5_9VIRU|nr:RNA-dependent RNA polymerase [Erysiphales narna-like virus 1]
MEALSYIRQIPGSLRDPHSSPTLGDTIKVPHEHLRVSMVKRASFVKANNRTIRAKDMKSVVIHEACHWVHYLYRGYRATYPKGQVLEASEQFLSAWFTTALAAGQNLFITHGRTPAHYFELTAWCYKIAVKLFLDLPRFYASVKLFCHSARSTWASYESERNVYFKRLFIPGFVRCKGKMDHKGKMRSYLQWSFLGRALGRGKREDFPNAIPDMIKRMSQPFKAAPLDLDIFSKVITPADVVQDREINLQSTSSCMQVPSSQGGRREYYSQLFSMFKTLPLKRLMFKNTADRISLYEREFLFKELENSGYDLDSTPVLILERGYKARVITKCCALRVAMSESYRKSVLRSLMRHRSVAMPQRGEFRRLPIGRRLAHKYVYSADLSNATDLLSLSLLEEICQYLNIPLCLVSGGNLYVPEETDRDGNLLKPAIKAEIKRGTLMGIPLSFVFLTMVHLYLCKYIGAPNNSYYIMGDDLIAYWPKVTIDKFEKNLHRVTGMLPNKSKSFTSKCRGIFCERAYHLTNGFLVEDSRYVSVKALTPLGSIDRNGERKRGMPWEFIPIEYLHASYDRIGHKRCFFLQQIACSDLVRYLEYLGRKYRISKYFPISMGGAGLIPMKAEHQFSMRETELLTAYLRGDADALDRVKVLALKVNSSFIEVDTRVMERLMIVMDFIKMGITQPKDLEHVERLESLVNKLRMYSEDVSLSEHRPTGQLVTVRNWFRNITSLPVASSSSNDPVLDQNGKQIVLNYRNLLKVLPHFRAFVPEENRRRFKLKLETLFPPEKLLTCRQLCLDV